ncbi:hypothetical protein KC331_g2935 [Hortaea werneckii]|nr:hypothetical protein KC331_g2935 [Hortaea werneckii]KAI7691065.1 hypothetical protein KC353_g19201 [Hortaea werneckii]
MLRGLDGVWYSSAGIGAGDAGEKSGAPGKMTLRVLSLKALELLVRRSRREGDRREFLSGEQLEKVFLDASDSGEEEEDGEVDLCTAISLLESLSTSALALAWPGTLLRRLAALFPRLATPGTEETSPSSSSKSSQPRQEHLHQQQQHTLFLLYRLTLNLTTDHPRNCSYFATRGTFSALLSSIYASFLALDAPSPPSDSALATNPKPPQQQQQQSSPPTTTPTPRALTLDLLILALGIAINLTTDYSDDNDNGNGTSTTPLLLLPLLIDPADPLSLLFARLVRVFRVGRVRIDRELDSSPPPDDGGKGRTARGEGAVSSGQTRGREREVRRREGERLGGEEEADGQGDGQQEDGQGDGDVGFNIAWGYLAVFLGRCCSFPSSTTNTTTSSSSSEEDATAGVGGREIRRFVAGCLQDNEEGGGSEGSATGRQPREKKKEDGTKKATSVGGLEILVQAVEEFVLYHQRVDGMMMNHSGSGAGGGHGTSQASSAAKGDMMDEDGLMMSGGGEKDEEAFAGQEGKEVWSAFTEKLRLVLERLKTVVWEDV